MSWTGSGTLVTSPSGLGTTTRAELRRAICRELHMPFARRVESGFLSVGASPAPTVTTLPDANLTQESDFWTGQWWYSVTNDEVRRITRVQADTNVLTLEYPATLPVAGDNYEIHAVWNAIDLHSAINRAINDAFPAFFDYVTDETTVMREDTLKYPTAGLTHAPWRIVKLWAEINDTKITGTATAGTTTLLTNTRADFSKVTQGWLVSIYSGTGAGQLREVNTATATTITPTISFEIAPDTTSKYAVWNPDSQTNNWEQILHSSFDAKEFPRYIYLTKQFPSSYGLRLRIEYTHKPSVMTLDSSVTAIPTEFLINKTLSILFGQKVNDNRLDRNRYANLEEYRRQLSEQYRTLRAFQQPDITVWQQARTLLSRPEMENPF